MANRITNSGAGSAPKYNAGGRKKKEVPNGKGVKSKIPDWVEENFDKHHLHVRHEMRFLDQVKVIMLDFAGNVDFSTENIFELGCRRWHGRLENSAEGNFRQQCICERP